MSVAHSRVDEASLRRALGPMGIANPELWSMGPRPSPIDIACELCRAMEVGKFTKAGTTVVQTVYTVELSTQDLDRFEGRKRELVATLKDALAWWAADHGYSLPGDLRVRLTENPDLRAGQLDIEAGLRAEEAAKLGRRRKAD